MHEYYRFNAPIFGDCGAWGYHKLETPPFDTREIMDYYQQTGVDLGVSIDHLAITNDESENMKRIELTMRNTEKFIDRYSMETMNLYQL